METPRLIEADVVPTAYISRVWPMVAPELERALARSDGEMALSDVLSFLVEGQMQLWVAHEGETPLAYAVTSIEDYPQQRAARITLLAGKEIEQWEHFIEKLERWAIMSDCEYIEWFGRPGFERVMKKHGYTRRYVLCRKRLILEGNYKVLH